jgi:hypothetical protein
MEEHASVTITESRIRNKRRKIRRTSRKRQKRKNGGGENEEVLLPDARHQGHSTSHHRPIYFCVETLMKYKTTALCIFYYRQINTTFRGHRTATVEAILFSNAMPSSALLALLGPSSLSSPGPRFEISVGSD